MTSPAVTRLLPVFDLEIPPALVVQIAITPLPPQLGAVDVFFFDLVSTGRLAPPPKRSQRLSDDVFAFRGGAPRIAPAAASVPHPPSESVIGLSVAPSSRFLLCEGWW
jgi:hypothetical protein